MTQADPPQLLGPDPIAAQRDDGSPSNDDLISPYEAGPIVLPGLLVVRHAGPPR